MASSSSSSWMPAQGRHQVNIGSSLGRALKARRLQGSAPPTNTKRNLPDRDFYSFRYNFKPGTIDANKPGTIEVQTESSKTAVTVEQRSTKPGEVAVFKGNEQSAKEMDCVLIYDEDTGTYTLEKLDSYINLKYERKATSVPAPPPSPPLAASPAPKAPAHPAVVDEYADELARDLLDLAEEDAEGEVDEDLEEVIRDAAFSREEEEEEEEIYIPPPKPPSPKPQPPPPKAARAVKPLPKSRVQVQAPVAAPAPVPAPTPAPPPLKPKSVAAKKKNAKREPEPVLHISEPEEEELSFGRPAKPAQPSPPAAAAQSSSAGWALPGSSSSFAALPPSKPVPSSSRAAPPPPAPIHIVSEEEGVGAEEDDDEWDEVKPVPIASDSGAHDDIFGGDDSDPDDLELVNELNQELTEDMDHELARDLDQALTQDLDSDEDFLADMEDTEPPPSKPIISLNQFAGGGVPSDDEYSSSDDSDED